MRAPSLRPRLAAAVLLLALPACALFEEEEPSDPGRSLPPGWSWVEPYAFERMILEELPPAPFPWSEQGRRELRAALDRMDETSVRAAVLLGRSGADSSRSALLARLEQRVVGPTRESDAGDVVAAAALPTFPGPFGRIGRLRALVVGRRPHPDLEVRVEAACSLLALGDDAGVPFLLQVLRIDTWAGQGDARDFEVSPHTAWARSRAAEALSARAGIPLAYRADASIADREREVQRLERILLPAG